MQSDCAYIAKQLCNGHFHCYKLTKNRLSRLQPVLSTAGDGLAPKRLMPAQPKVSVASYGGGFEVYVQVSE